MSVNLLDERAKALTVKMMDKARLKVGPSATGFPYPFGKPIFYVKFGNQEKHLTQMEARTQQFAYEAVEKLSATHPDASRLPRIPRVLRLLETRHVAYIVMEYAPGPTLLQLSKNEPAHDEAVYVAQIARGIEGLLSIPVAANAPPGPPGGGIIKHPLFKDGQAAKAFESVASLQDHINTMSSLPRTSGHATRPRVELEHELHFVYSDLYPGNFVFSSNGDMWILDFGHASLLPLSFQSYALSSPFPRSYRYASLVRCQLRIQLPETNLAAMQRAHDFFVLCVFGFGECTLLNLLYLTADRLAELLPRP